MTIALKEELPSAEEYVSLRVAAGLSGKSLAAARVGLPNSLYAVCVRNDGRLIGMGRVIGDGACFFEVVDIAVDPNYQGQGLGKKIMLHIDDYLQRSVMDGSYVSMIADEPQFYARLGYRLTAPASHGMYKRFEQNES